MESRSVILNHKPGATLCLSYHDPSAKDREPFTDTLVVFLNGLALSREAWIAAADQLISARQEAHLPIPPLLCYDRYGQGTSDEDPTDPADTPYGHDIRTAVDDLHLLLERVCSDDFGIGARDVRLILVCNSIGCALARLYAAAHPGCVEAVLMLDPMVANSDFVSMFPDPDDPDFDAGNLAEGVSVDDVRHARAVFGKLFHPTVTNKEKLDRRNLAELLPYADKPALPNGPDGKPPLLLVVGHDWEAFAEQCEKGPVKMAKAVTQAYVNPHWGSYNDGLTKIGESGKVRISKGCGHFIQRDDPSFVATELSSLLDEIVRRRSN